MHDYGGWMWFLIDNAVLALLAAAIVAGVDMWRQHHRAAVTRGVPHEATRGLHRRRS